jgi:hypothetical protein
VNIQGDFSGPVDARHMALTGSALPLILALLAVVMFVLLVIGPVRGRGVRTVATRAAAALALNASVVALCGVLLNDRYLFYVTWADLVGAGETQGQTLTAGGGAAAATDAKLPVAIHVDPNATLPPLPSPGGQWQDYPAVTGPSSGVTGQILVYLPKGYDPTSSRTYPVIEALHGWPGGPSAVDHEMALDSTFQGLVDQKALRPPIVVMPQINTPLTVDTECVDAPPGHGLKTMTWLGADVPAWTAAHFRVDAARSSWLALGVSYGGWCAANVGMHYPAVFGGAVSFMGYFAPEFYGYKPFRDDPAGLKTYDLTWMARHRPPPIAMWLMASKEDRSAYAALVPFVKAARAPLSVTAHVLTHGGHNVDTIPPTLSPMVTWLVATLPGFDPHGRA